MLTIRKEQMQAFEQAAMNRFEDEMVVHGKEFSPRLCTVIGDEQVRTAVRSAIERCRGYGFTNRGSIRLFIELMLLFGSAFDTDPQYSWASEILHAPDDQMLRAERLCEKTLDYQEKVTNPDPVDTRKALKGLSDWARKHAVSSPTEFVAGMLHEMAQLCPQKAVYIGEEGLIEIVLEGCAEAMKYQLSTVHGEALMGVLMFVFGHGCIDDPLYPWIAQTLTDKRIMDPAGRTGGFEREAFAFLDSVIAAQQEGERT
jgi:hypothetical protein